MVGEIHFLNIQKKVWFLYGKYIFFVKLPSGVMIFTNTIPFTE